MKRERCKKTQWQRVGRTKGKEEGRKVETEVAVR